MPFANREAFFYNALTEALGIACDRHRDATRPVAHHEAQLVIKILKNSTFPLDIDTIVRTSGLEVSVVNQALSALLVENIVEETSAGYTLTKG